MTTLLRRLEQAVYKLIIPDFVLKWVFDWGNFAPGETEEDWLEGTPYDWRESDEDLA